MHHPLSYCVHCCFIFLSCFSLVAPELQDGKTRRAFCLLLYPHYSEECLEKVSMFLIRASFRETYRYCITRTLKTASGCLTQWCAHGILSQIETVNAHDDPRKETQKNAMGF